MTPTMWWASWKIRYIGTFKPHIWYHIDILRPFFWEKKILILDSSLPNHSPLPRVLIQPVTSGAPTNPQSSKIHDAPKSDSNDLKALTLGRWLKTRLEHDVQFWMFRLIDGITKDSLKFTGKWYYEFKKWKMCATKHAEIRKPITCWVVVF